ncbi:unnamed protein product [Cyprideis torosa]|uniref:Uncharacterized protein n=1 Tax=Cyprideis torosa TaxID=163714 RepID=A0A7R8WHU8_9CRUS|nr:unnamed protein product [Cyprideis torosa]CAG0894469.1 unnamed protein product [Cyprideis torosa]
MEENSTDSQRSPDDQAPQIENPDVEPIVYGELVILGYNGSLEVPGKGRKKSKLRLLKRPVPNGVKRSKNYVVEAPQRSFAMLDPQKHSISYTLSRDRTVIQECVLDPNTDMFQVGRSSDDPIDFVVMDTIPGEKRGDPNHVRQSTISRFACRILVERKAPFTARVYAAGFDSSKNIFLGEKASKWKNGNNQWDGLTTNGILALQHKGSFYGAKGVCGIWREVSVGGDIFCRREARSSNQKGHQFAEETNELHDGTLIDLCGATLLWRSREGLKNSPTKEDLEQLVDALNAGRPQCPVGLNTLVLPRKQTQMPADKVPYVYLKCGHVQGYHQWGRNEENQNRTCPVCFKSGGVARLMMGMEPAFYVDKGVPSYAFNPCGHIASEATVKYWVSVPIPCGNSGSMAICPFCAVRIHGYPGYVKLIWP